MLRNTILASLLLFIFTYAHAGQQPGNDASSYVGRDFFEIIDLEGIGYSITSRLPKENTLLEYRSRRPGETQFRCALQIIVGPDNLVQRVNYNSCDANKEWGYNDAVKSLESQDITANPSLSQKYLRNRVVKIEYPRIRVRVVTESLPDSFFRAANITSAEEKSEIWKFVKQENWPAGISDREHMKSDNWRTLDLISKYTAYFVAFVDGGYGESELLYVPASANQAMAADMRPRHDFYIILRLPSGKGINGSWP